MGERIKDKGHFYGMRAWAVLVLFLGMAGPSLAQQDFFSVSARPLKGDSLRVHVRWTKPEKETVSLRLVLMDFDGQNAKEWQERIRLRPGQDTGASFGPIDPKLYGLDSAQAVVGIEARLSCGCETRQAVHYFAPIAAQRLPDPGLMAGVAGDKRKGYFLRITALRLAREVRVMPTAKEFTADTARFDLLPGETMDVRITGASPKDKPRPEDFTLQSAYPKQK